LKKQNTIKKYFSLKGKGLQTGKSVKVTLYPEKAGNGVIFVRKDLKNAQPIALKNASVKLWAEKRRTKIGIDEKNYVETVEHLLAALWAWEIDNVRIELTSSEPPALDGGAKTFLESLEKAGKEESALERHVLKIKEPVWAEENDSFLGIFPSSIFKISCVNESKNPLIGRQTFSEEITKEIFKEEIAPARTIWFVPGGKKFVILKAVLVRALGYGRGSNFKNTLIIGEKSFINKPILDNEPVKHKVLDLLGDLYSVGFRLQGRVIAIRNGHKLNLELVRKLKERYSCR